MRKISTGFKIILAFIVIALIFAFVGFMGINGIGEINANGDSLYTRNTMGISYSGSVALSFAQMRLKIMELGLTTEVEEKKEKIAGIEGKAEELDNWLKLYEGTIAGGDNENKEIFAALKSSWNQFRNYRLSSLDYYKQNLEQDLSSFTTEFVLGNVELNDTIEANLAALVTLNEQRAKSVNDNNKAHGDSTTLLVISLTGAGVAVAVFLGLTIGRSISKTVRRASKQLMKIAEGEDVSDLDAKKFSGEFINIATNLNAVQASLKRLLADARSLAAAGIEGNLSTRADLSAHKGNFRAIIEDFNNSLDAFTAPIQEMTEVLRQMHGGNLNVSVAGDYPGDYAEIKDALNDTAATIKGYIEEVAQILESMSVGDLTRNIETEYRGDFVTLRDSINRINDSLNALLRDILLSANQVAAGTRHVSDGSQSISAGASEQASAIEQLTATVAHIAEQTKLNAQHANKAKSLSADVGDSAKGGDTNMEKMLGAMIDIRMSSENISKIIKVIDDIAFQTNILALNAAVEAARAGSHGRGFAVVADEVRNLATRSATAAAETTALIENSIQKVQQGTNIANQTAESLRNIVTGVDNTSTLVSEIADASNQQATAITQVNDGIENLTSVVQSNSATSEQTAAAAQELSSQAEMLRSMVKQFVLRDDEQGAGEYLPEEPLRLESPVLPDPAIKLDDGFGKY